MGRQPLTYRFYDYGRLENGKPRQLHIEKSLDVTTAPFVSAAPEQSISHIGDATITHLVTYPYYGVYRAELDGKARLNWTQPFVNVSILDGSGTLDGMTVKKGDHLLICADYGPMAMIGEMEMIWSYV